MSKIEYDQFHILKAFFTLSVCTQNIERLKQEISDIHPLEIFNEVEFHFCSLLVINQLGDIRNYLNFLNLQM